MALIFEYSILDQSLSLEFLFIKNIVFNISTHLEPEVEAIW